MKKIQLLGCVCAGLLFAGCDKNDDVGSSPSAETSVKVDLDDTKDNIKDAFNDAERKLEKGAREARAKLEDAGDKLQDKYEDAKDRLDNDKDAKVEIEVKRD